MKSKPLHLQLTPDVLKSYGYVVRTYHDRNFTINYHKTLRRAEFESLDVKTGNFPVFALNIEFNTSPDLNGGRTYVRIEKRGNEMISGLGYAICRDNEPYEKRKGFDIAFARACKNLVKQLGEEKVKEMIIHQG